MAVGTLVWFAVLVGVVGTRSDPLRIVAFHYPEDGLHRHVAFEYAVQHMNNDLRHPNILDLEMRNVKPFDSFGTGLITCDLAAKGLAGVFGPQSTSSMGIVRSVCERLEIPHVITIWEPNAVISQHTNNLYPDAEIFSQALAEVVRQMRWRSYTVLYQDDSALVRLQGVLQNSDKGDNPIILRQLDPNKDYRPMLKEIKMSTETRIILDCDPEDILDILRAADSVSMMDVYCSYLITSLDGHTVDYSEFSDGPNITTLRMVDPTSPIVENAVRDWIDGEKRLNRDLSLTPDTVKIETALAYDAVLLYTEAVVLLNTTGHITQEPLECRDSRRWTKGLGISNFMRLRQIQGMTGLIELDTNGRRTSFSVDLVEYTPKGFQKVGDWNPIDRFVSTRSHTELETQIAGVLGRKLMIVSSKLGPPFLMERNQSDPPTLFGNDRYEGFSLDLIDDIAQELKFKYEFRLVPDQKHGTQDPKTGEWNGLMGELLNRRADLAICDLTITYEREKAVDFTMPFMNLGISILYKKTAKSETNLFSFLEPFSFDVWIYMATAYLGVSVILFVLSSWNAKGHSPSEIYRDMRGVYGDDCLDRSNVSRWCAFFQDGYSKQTDFYEQGIMKLVPRWEKCVEKIDYRRACPFEWNNPHPCNPEPEELENSFNLINCLWFSMGSILGQGCDILPKISPYEWVSKHPCQAEPTELVNSLSMNNSIWHNCGSLMQQGSDIAPQAVSTRMVAGMWWFFTLIMISSYTANLAAFLTVAKMEEDIKGVDDLAKQTRIKYGTYKYGSTARFFQTSNVSLYQRIWNVMQQTRPDVFTEENTQGVDRVRNSKGKYAFFMESTSIEYQMERDCDLVKIGGELDSKGYGIAMPPGSPYRIKMNEAILKLQEAGRLKFLKKRWWKEKGGGKCDSEGEQDEADSNKLGLPNVGGVFLVLFFGCAAAFVVSVLEFLWNCRKIAVQEKITPWEAIVSELKFAMTCSADSKPVIRKPPETDDVEMMEGGSFLEMNYKYDIGPK